MNIEIKSIHSPDIENLETYVPLDSENFTLFLELIIGFKGKRNGDIFRIVVCTPKWMDTNYSNGDVVIGRGKLIVLEYDYDRILKRISNYVTSLSVRDWAEAVEKLSRISVWEYEDYTEYKK